MYKSALVPPFSVIAYIYINKILHLNSVAPAAKPISFRPALVE